MTVGSFSKASLLAAAATLAVACADKGDDTGPGADGDSDCETQTWYVDFDGDGYGNDASTTEACEKPPGHAAKGGDCQDKDEEINPGATEICDERDNNCDGEIDEGATLTFYADHDGDGQGTADESQEACSTPGGDAPAWVETTDDCDDTDADIHPEAEEICDGVDNDCDSLVDDDDDDLTGALTLYPDADGDGFGDATAEPITSCLSSGYVSNADDCDDTDDTVYPDALEECADEVDRNCDGEVGPKTIDFEGTIDSTVMTLNNDAVQDDGWLVLTPASASSWGTAFFHDTVTTDSFAISFTFQIGGGSGGADGMTFAFLTESDPTSEGSSGGGLGVATLEGWAIELDTYNNGTRGDVDGNHIGLMETGDLTHLEAVAVKTDLNDNKEHDLEVTFEDGDVSVWLDGTLTLEATISDYSSSELMLGFTAGTGSYYQRHAVDDVLISCD